MKAQTKIRKANEIARRRRLIGRLMARQQDRELTLEQIAERLAFPRTRGGKIDRDRQSVDPDGKPWSRMTISRDMREIRADWHQEATLDAATWKKNIIAQYQELLEQYWKTAEFEGVERVLASLRKIIGTDSDQVALMEQLQLQLSIAAMRLRAEFEDDPVMAQRAFRALAGNPNADISSVPDAPRELMEIEPEENLKN